MTQPGQNGRDYQRALVAAIRAGLGGRGWSRKQLAERSGITEQQMERIFNLKRDMNVAQFERIADALGVAPDDLAVEARRWRTGVSARAIPADVPRLPTDPRELLRALLDNPDMDDELTHRLVSTLRHVGERSARAKQLAQTVRQLRREELEHALASLPPSENRAAGQ